MPRAQPKSSLKAKRSPTDEHPRRIAGAIAKGRPPPSDDDLEEYCARMLAARNLCGFAGAAPQMPPAGKDEALAFGYLFLLQRLRYYDGNCFTQQRTAKYFG